MKLMSFNSQNGVDFPLYFSLKPNMVFHCSIYCSLLYTYYIPQVIVKFIVGVCIQVYRNESTCKATFPYVLPGNF